MTYLIDTDVLISLMQGDPLTRRLFDELQPRGISVSAVTYMEALQGVLSHPGGDQTAFERLLRRIPVLSVDRDVALRCAYLRMLLSRRGKRVRQRALDLLIAATAIEHNLTLVTRNDRDYRDIPGLVLFEDLS